MSKTVSRGMDYWTYEQIEGQRRMMDKDLEMLEFEKKALETRMKVLEDAIAACDEELQDRRREEEEEVMCDTCAVLYGTGSCQECLSARELLKPLTRDLGGLRS